MKLTVIVTSTRPGRIGRTVADWFHDYAKANPAGFDIGLADLRTLDLPVLDEPNHPAKQDYQHEHTQRWARIVDDSDAFVFVLPEYNYTAPPSFYNALDYLYKEWNYKPAGFVSYGGVSGGIRATETAKSFFVGLEVMPVKQQVMIPMVADHIEDDRFKAAPIHEQSAQALLESIARWSSALKTMR